MSSPFLSLPKTYRLIHIMRPIILFNRLYSTIVFISILHIFMQYNAVLTIDYILHLSDNAILDIFLVLIFCMSPLLIIVVTRCIYCPNSVRRARLVLSPEGVTLYGITSQRFTPWHNIASIAYRRWGRYLSKKLQLRQPALLRVKLAEGIRQDIAVLDTPWYLAWRDKRQTGFVPLSFSKLDWVNSELDAYLRQYAPQAFSSPTPIPNALDLDNSSKP